MDFIKAQAAAWTQMREKWAGNESVNGPGSTMALTKTLRTELPRIFEQYGITSVLDLPCGDWNWMRHVDLSAVRYAGWDVEPELIRGNLKYQSDTVTFACVNALTINRYPKMDLIVMKDFLYHLPTKAVEHVVDQVVCSGSKYLLATHTPGVNNAFDRVPTRMEGEEGIDGYYVLPLDLEKPPFMLPPALENIVEEADADYDCAGVARRGMTNHTNSLFDLQGA